MSADDLCRLKSLSQAKSSELLFEASLQTQQHTDFQFTNQEEGNELLQPLQSYPGYDEDMFSLLDEGESLGVLF
jgi:hypothetical protein